MLAILLQLIRDDAPRWVSAVSMGSALVAIGLAATHTVPNAVRLGARRDTVEVQSRLARSVLRDHVVCLALISLLLGTQRVWA
ncbi:MAG: hypothetical protein ACHQNA_01575 [Acidimicrobiales bacterium]